MVNFKILRSADIQLVLDFEKDLLTQKISSEVERELFSWKAPWRQEALEYYLPLGWSFAAWEGKESESPLMGYFLGQPLLFFKGMTQTLWLEHLVANSENLRNELLDVAYKTSREKHFQTLLFSKQINFESSPLKDKVQSLDDSLNYIKSSKISGDL